MTDDERRRLGEIERGMPSPGSLRSGRDLDTLWLLALVRRQEAEIGRLREELGRVRPPVDIKGAMSTGISMALPEESP